MTPLDLFFMGGWVMWPILATSVAALTIVVGRVRYVLQTRGDARALERDVLDLVTQGRHDDARTKCDGSPLPVAKMMSAGLQGLEQSADEMDRRLEVAAAAAVDEAEAGLPALATTNALLPMLGFFGTIVGLVNAFLEWQKLGENATIDQLSGGIASAMVTTGAGLVTAIPYTLAYNFFAQHAHKLARQLNAAGAELSARCRAARKPATVTPLRPVDEASQS